MNVGGSRRSTWSHDAVPRADGEPEGARAQSRRPDVQEAPKIGGTQGIARTIEARPHDEPSEIIIHPNVLDRAAAYEQEPLMINPATAILMVRHVLAMPRG